MSQPDKKVQQELFQQITDFIGSVEGLDQVIEKDIIKVKQKMDNKSISIKMNEVKDVLERKDTSGQDFVQVNFHSGNKILITESLIGFKPVPLDGLELDKLPKVVTTPDLLSVFEAVEEALSSFAEPDEIETLKLVYYSIIEGGEAVGFDLVSEKTWFSRLQCQAASA